MTKKDYIKIAALLKRHRDSILELSEDDILDSIAFDLAFVMKEDNSNFDEERFYEAAGVIHR